MKRNMVIVSVAAVGLLIPALAFAGPRGQAVKQQRQQQKEERKSFRQTQQEEKKSFRESVKNMTGEEKQSAIQTHRQEQAEERKSFRQTQQEENKAFIDDLKSGNKTANLTESAQ